jgi:ABC-2 type transport system ATP-binding protein
VDLALEIRCLSKAYKGFALKDVSFSLPQGTIMGLVGPNGAGKTTIIKLILNHVRRQAGEIRIFGQDAILNEKAVKARIGFVHETPAFTEDAPLKDIVSAVAPFYAKWDARLFRSLAGEFGLPLDKKFKKLSHGTKMKFSLALALAHDADLLVLDEPTSGLDPVFRRELLERLSGIIQDERKAVLFSTHITSDLEQTADFITFLNAGRVVFSLPKDEVRETWAVVKSGPELLNGRSRSIFRSIRQMPHGVEALTSDIPAVRAAFPSGIVIDRASLEDIMVFMNEGRLPCEN